MNCYLSRNYRNSAYAGNKAKIDIEQIMQNLGYTNIWRSQTRYSGVVSAFMATLASMAAAPFHIGRGDVLVLQYPLKKYFRMQCRIAHARGAKVVVIIHDLGSFRRKKLTIPEEIKKLSLADYVIAHSEAMRAWLIEHGFRKPVGVLGLFDFLSDSKPASRTKAPEKPYKVMYVGDLSYSYNAALYEMGQNAANWTTVLYGGGFELEKATPGCRIDYRGYINSDDLIAAPDADFGLVWYGSARPGCECRLGDYLRYIAAHKLSLYLRCEVPVIVGKGTAMAEFVEREGIGITVEEGPQFDVGEAAAGRRVRLMDHEGPAALGLPAEVPAVAVRASIKLAPVGLHANERASRSRGPQARSGCLHIGRTCRSRQGTGREVIR